MDALHEQVKRYLVGAKAGMPMRIAFEGGTTLGGPRPEGPRTVHARVECRTNKAVFNKPLAATRGSKGA